MELNGASEKGTVCPTEGQRRTWACKLHGKLIVWDRTLLVCSDEEGILLEIGEGWKSKTKNSVRGWECQ